MGEGTMTAMRGPGVAKSTPGGHRTWKGKGNGLIRRRKHRALSRMWRAAAGFALAAMVITISPAADAEATDPNPAIDEDIDTEEPGRTDPLAPFVVLSEVIDQLTSQVRGAAASGHSGTEARARGLATARALDHTARALERWVAERPDAVGTVSEIGAAVVALADAAPGSPAARTERDDLARRLTATARRIAVDIDGALSATGGPTAGQAKIVRGDQLLQAGNLPGAVQAYHGAAEGFSSLTFDMKLFEKKLHDDLLGQAIGYTYAIAQGGELTLSTGRGLARAYPDDNIMLWEPGKESNLGSVSKNLTATAVMQLLNANNLTIDSPIAPYFPPSWKPSTSVSKLTFRALLSHRSGLRGGGTWDTLKQVVATEIDPEVADPDHNGIVNYSYQNVNFALFRMIIPYMWDESRVTLAFSEGLFLISEMFTGGKDSLSRAQKTTEWYEDYMQKHVFGPIGVEAQCGRADPVPVLSYDYPHYPEDPGGPQPSKSSTLTCGAGGIHASAEEVLRYMSYRRYTEALLPIGLRKAQDANYLGWRPPTDASTSGKFGGIYRVHGGQVNNYRACITEFTMEVQVVLLLNSPGVYGDKCQVLKDAFEWAWVAKS